MISERIGWCNVTNDILKSWLEEARVQLDRIDHVEETIKDFHTKTGVELCFKLEPNPAKIILQKQIALIIALGGFLK